MSARSLNVLFHDWIQVCNLSKLLYVAVNLDWPADEARLWPAETCPILQSILSIDLESTLLHQRTSANFDHTIATCFGVVHCRSLRSFVVLILPLQR